MPVRRFLRPGPSKNWTPALAWRVTFCDAGHIPMQITG
jgi:hypothetical protein